MVLNRIEQKQRERDETVRRAEAERQRTLEKQRQAEARARLEWQQQAEQRLQFVRNQSHYALTASGVLRALEEIRDGKLAGSVRKYALVVNLDGATAELVWGNKFSVEKNAIGYERAFFGDGVKDYQSVSVRVDPDTLELCIFGGSSSRYPQQQWQNDPGVVLDALVEAYLDPRRVVERESDYRHSSSSSGYSSEC